MKYIDAEKLIALLEQRKKQLARWTDKEYANQRIDEIDCILDVDIDSLQQEQSKADLDADIEMEWDSFNKHITKYSEGTEEVVWLNWLSFVDIANYFYELGLNAKKEE